jgi:ATP-binding cassette subfamily C protein CydC
LWILPFAALLISLGIYAIFLALFSQTLAIEFIISAALLLFLIPQFILSQNRKLYLQLKTLREEHNQSLIQSFRGRIEISKYNLEQKAINQHNQRMLAIEQLETKLQTNSFSLQLIIGFGFSIIATLILWHSGNQQISPSLGIGIFFGIMAQAELAEMLFSGKSEKSSVAHQIADLEHVISTPSEPVLEQQVTEPLTSLKLTNFSAQIPQSPVTTHPLTLHIAAGQWVAIYGETGKGKTTLLNSLFYPEYQLGGTLTWNEQTSLKHLPVPACIYVTQKAYLLTGTLRENFQGQPDADILQALQTVDLNSWYQALPQGLDSWIGENGETLSGGQRKKLLLAQALLKKPQLLVVDEPTAGISTQNAIQIFQNIKAQQPTITILMATHLTDFKTVVDQVVHI